MPPGPSTKKKATKSATKEALRAARGVTDDRLKILENQSTVGHDNQSSTVKTQHRHTRTHLTKFFATFSADEKLQLLPEGIDSVDSLLQPHAPHLSFGTLSTYIRWYATGTVGHLGELASLATILDLVDRYSSLVKNATGQQVDRIIRGSLRTWIRETLAPELGLQDVYREKGFVLSDDLRDISYSFMDSDTLITEYRLRIVATLWLVIQTADSIRIGALIPQIPDAPDQKNLLWSHLRIQISRPRPGTLRNQIAITCPLINAKNHSSRGYHLIFTEALYLWADRVFLTLCLAFYSDAFPTGYTYESLYDPALFTATSPSIVEVRFAATADETYVFASRSDPKKPMDAFTINEFLATGATAASLNMKVTSHMLRRSGAIIQTMLGRRSEEIQQQLTHAWGSACYKLYTQNLITKDVQGAVFGPANGDIQTAQELHPERVGRTKVTQCLSNEARRQILDSDNYLSLKEEYIIFRNDTLHQNQCKLVSELPSEIRAQVMAKYALISREFHRQRRYHKAIIIWQDRQIASGGNETATSATAEHEKVEWIDQFPQGEEVDGEVEAADRFLYYNSLDNLQDGLSAAFEEGVMDAEQSDSATPITATPGPSVSGNDAHESMFATDDPKATSNHPVEIALQVIESSYRKDPAGLGSLDTVPTVPCATSTETATPNPAIDVPIDPELLKEVPYQSEKSKGKRPAKATSDVPATSSSKSSAVASTSESGACISKRRMNATTDPNATSNSSSGPSDQSSDQKRKKRKSLDPKPSNRYSQDPLHSGVPLPLLAVQQALFDKPANEMDLTATFDLLTSIPNDDKLLLAFRPGEWPINDRCRFCDESVEDIYQKKATGGFLKKSETKRSTEVFALNSNGRRCLSLKAFVKMVLHVRDCHPAFILDHHIDELLQRYPARTATNFHIAKPIREAKGTQPGFPVSKLLSALNDNYSAPYRLKHLDTYQHCQTCPDKPKLATAREAANHQIVHGIYVPRDETKLRKERYAGLWTKDVITFPQPAYYNITGRYHWDPKDHYDTAKKILQDIYWRCPATIDKFGRDPSILYASGELSGDPDGLPTDTRYKLLTGRHDRVLAQARCFICVNDPDNDPRHAAKTYDTLKNVISHCIFCIIANFNAALSAKQSYANDPTQLPKPEHFLCRDGQLLCPDIVCRQNQRIFGDTLEMLQHFVAVHGMHVRGNRSEYWSELPSLSSLTLPDQESMDIWLKEKRLSFASFADATEEKAGDEDDDEEGNE